MSNNWTSKRDVKEYLMCFLHYKRVNGKWFTKEARIKRDQLIMAKKNWVEAKKLNAPCMKRAVFSMLTRASSSNKVIDRILMSIFWAKNPHYLPHFLRKSAFPPRIPKSGKTPPSTFKTVHLPPWPVISGFEGGFVFFHFYLFRLNLWKIIVNHRKIIK
jgi:hypothetical protein